MFFNAINQGIFAFLLAAALLSCTGNEDIADQHTQTEPSKLEGKTVFDYTFPRYLAFRGELNRPNHASYEAWCKSLGDASAVMQKFVFEELEINENSPSWANRYAAEHPEVLMMLHLNGWARQVVRHPEVTKLYFPGHWVYLAGSMIENNIGINDDVFKVSDIKPFAKKGYQNSSSPGEYLPLEVVIVSVDGDGNKIWSEAEFAEVTEFNRSTREVKLSRGFLGTKKHVYSGNRAYMAPFQGHVLGNSVMWWYNMSSCCPKDENGKRAYDIYAEEVSSWFQEGGILDNFDGIAFDVNSFDVSDKDDWDVDNNGVADGGWLDKVNVWREGDIMMLSKLRSLVGEDFVISADAQQAANQQAPMILNGMESEGLVQWNDMWRGFSRAVNTHLYWAGHKSRDYAYRYVVMKVNGPDADDAEHCRRFGAASAFCLGAYITDPGDRLFVPEEFRPQGSLGKIRGELIRCIKGKQPQVSYSGGDLMNKISADGLTKRLKYGAVEISFPGLRANDGLIKELDFSIPDIDIPGGDVVFFIKAKTAYASTSLSADYGIPAAVWLRPDTLPVYTDDVQYNDLFCDLHGLAGRDSFEDLSYYFRNMPSSCQNISVRARGVDRIFIEELSIYSGTDVIMREFDNGVVVVNPSLNPVSINPHDFCDRVEDKEISIPALDVAYLGVKPVDY